MLTNLWQDFLNIAREELGSRVVDTWLKAVSFSQWNPDGAVVYVQAPNNFVKEWIQGKYAEFFRVQLQRLLNVKDIKIIFLGPTDHKEKTSHFPMIVPKKSIRATKSDALVVESHQGARLQPDYVFEKFVVGSNNSLAYAAARAVSEEPGTHYNPLFLYGCSGLGKTHLLHAIGNAIQKNNPKALVMYQTTDRFVNEFITAIRFNKVQIFQQKYRRLDVLLIDDIQFISNKEQTQEAFFHIFNALYDKRKQIVFSSDLFPRDISGLEERLRSRLEGGLIADIYKPSLETKIAILKQKAIEHNEVLTDELAECIAHHVVSNIRELEGVLVRIIAFGSLTRQPITIELVKKVLHQSQGSRQEEKVDFEKITSHVCKFYSYKLADLRSESRAKDIALVRQVAMYLMKQMTNKSLNEIGTYLGRKNHSTVIHGFDRVKDALQSNPDLKMTIDKLKEEILR